MALLLLRNFIILQITKRDPWEDFPVLFWSGVAVGIVLLLIGLISDVFIKKRRFGTTLKNFFIYLYFYIRRTSTAKKKYREYQRKNAEIEVSLELFHLSIQNKSGEFQYINEIHFVNERGSIVNEYLRKYGMNNDLHLALPQGTRLFYKIQILDNLGGKKVKAFIRTDKNQTYESNFMIEEDGWVDDPNWLPF